MRKILNKINWAFARKKLNRMRPEDLVGQLGKDWKAYLKWRKHRLRLSSWLENVDRIINDMIDRAFRKVIMIFEVSPLIVVGIILCSVVLGWLAKILFPGMISIIKIASFSPIILTLSLTFLYMAFKIIAIIIVIIVNLINSIIKINNDSLLACTTDLKRFLKHRHGTLKNMYRSMVKNHVIERYCNEAWGGSEILDNNEDSSYYGIARILSTVFLSQPDSGGYGFYYYTHKTLEMIEFMLIVHRSLLNSNIDKISLLVQQWPDLFTRRISWDDYNDKLDSMLSEARKISSRVEEEDRNIVLDRLESLKHDSDVLNGSPDVVKMRDLVKRVHDSSTELVGRRAS